MSTNCNKKIKTSDTIKNQASIGLFGGSFDPFHNGHLAMTEAAIAAFHFDKLLVMPVGLPSHKSRRLSFSTFRAETARLATEHLPEVVVSDKEILSPRRNFTVDTVEKLLSDYPSARVSLISGSDFLFTVKDWHRYEKLLSLVSFAIALRGNADKEESEQQAEYLRKKYNADINFFTMKASTVSATRVRERLIAGDSAYDLLPEKVYDLLNIYRPYSFNKIIDDLDDISWRKINAYERRLFGYLGRERRLHSVSTCLLALELAAIHKVPSVETGIAALFHDLAKELPGDEQELYSKKYLAKKESDCELQHGPAAAYLARELFAVTSDDVLNAIQYHTTGRPEMTTLEKIIFLADKIEYGRPFKNLDSIRSLAFAAGAGDADKEICLDRAVCRCYEEVFAALERSGHKICQLSKDAYNILKYKGDRSL